MVFLTTACLPPSLNRGLRWKAMSLPRTKFTVNLGGDTINLNSFIHQTDKSMGQYISE
jgi:hypothetical protein